jgi:hypothetical protein
MSELVEDGQRPQQTLDLAATAVISSSTELVGSLDLGGKRSKFLS